MKQTRTILSLATAAMIGIAGCASGDESDDLGSSAVDSAGGNMTTGTTGAPGLGTAGTPGTPGATMPDTITPGVAGASTDTMGMDSL